MNEPATKHLGGSKVDPMNTLARGWHQFWFAPQSTSTLALVRIAFGLVVIGWMLSVLPDIGALYSESGVAPSQPGRRSPLTLLAWWDTPLAVGLLWAAAMFAAVCLAVGLRTRLAALVVFIALLSFHSRNPYTVNSGDTLMRLLALYLVLAPAGAALSVDRWRAHRAPFWSSPQRAPWALRLIQVQVSVLYLFSVFHKVRGDSWADGSAYGYIVQLNDVQRIAPPDFVADSAVLVGLLTYGTLVVELALAVLIWNRRALPWVIAAGVALHLGIEVTMTLGFFSLTVLASYVAFVPADVGDRVIEATRQRWVAFRAERSRHPHDTDDDADGADDGAADRLTQSPPAVTGPASGSTRLRWLGSRQGS